MRLTRHQLRRIIQESVTLDIEKGDVILTGKFKNKRTVVKDFGTDDLGQPTINGMKLLKFRIEKLMPQDKWSKKSQEEAGLEEGKTMKITKRQLKRIINEALTDPPPGELEPEWFRSMKDAEDAAVGMVFGDGSQKLGDELPWEVRIVSIGGEYVLYAMADGRDRYDGEGKEVAAVPRGGSIRYGRQIG